MNRIKLHSSIFVGGNFGNSNFLFRYDNNLSRNQSKNRTVNAVQCQLLEYEYEGRGQIMIRGQRTDNNKRTEDRK